ncbi:MAG: SBBP repeat-containing protein [Candidatus Kapabacteria bacterium]|nr:SBBP repeat-containing protein [Candidatus Kapabacteria bacterium]
MKFLFSIVLWFLFAQVGFSQQLSFVENNGFSKDTWKYVLRSPKSSIYFYENYFVIQTFQQTENVIAYENIPIYFENSTATIESQLTNHLDAKTYRFHSDTNASSSSHFESIIYRNISKNVDCRFFVFNNTLRFDFIVKDKSVKSLSLTTSDGNFFSLDQSKVSLTTSSNSKHFLQDIVLVYPESRTIKPTVSSTKQKLTFTLPVQSNFAIIDPTFSFASFLGGSSSEYIYDVKILDNNRLYAVGYTTSLDFPTTPGVYKSTTTNADVFVYAVDLNTNQLLFSTFIGGTNSEIGYGIDIASNTIIICGQTNSINFPVTAGAFSTTFNGGNQDGFVSGLSINGSALQFSTFVGGSDSDVLSKIAVNSQGSIFACGMSRSANFPLGFSPAQFLKGNGNDGVVISLSPTASSLFGGTFLGGNNEDKITNLSISSTNEIVVVGTTSSPNFPLQQPMYPTYNGGLSDAFITRYNQNLSSVLFSTYFGGNNDDLGNAISFDAQNNIIIGGTTNSTNIPIVNEIYKNNRGGNDVFLAKILPNRMLDFSTYLGGINDDNLEDLAVNSFGNIYITGFTNSNDFPLSKDAPFTENKGSGDMFISKLYRSGQSILYSTYYGDIFQDVSTSLSINSFGIVALGGYTQSSTLQTLNSIDSTFNGGFFDAYLLTFFLPDLITTIATDSVQLSYCKGIRDSVSFSFVGGFERNNTFTVELSDSNGNFSPGRAIGSIQSPNPRLIPFFIPFDIVPSDKYKLRVKSSSPVVIGAPTVHSITINGSPNVTLGNDTTLCLGSQIEIGSSLNEFPMVQWFSTDTTIKNIQTKTIVLAPRKTHKYWAIVADSNGCTGIDTIQISVQNPPKTFLPETIQFCETDTVFISIPDSLVVTNIVPITNSVLLKDSLILFHTSTNETVFITIENKNNACSIVDTVRILPIDIIQVTFTEDLLDFSEKQECQQYTKGTLSLVSTGSSTVIIDSIVIDNSSFSFDSLVVTRKKNQISIQPNTPYILPIYFLGNQNQTSIVRIYSSKCILTDSIILVGNVDKNIVVIPSNIIHNKELHCRNNISNKTHNISVYNNTNSRKIITLETDNIPTIIFNLVSYEVNSNDSIFIEYLFSDSLVSQSDTIIIEISDSICTKKHTIVLSQNIINLTNQYSIENTNIDTILCDNKTLKISLPIQKILRKQPNNDSLRLLNSIPGLLLQTHNNQNNIIQLSANDSLYFDVDIDQLSTNQAKFTAQLLPCNDTISFELFLDIKHYSSKVVNNSIIQKTSTNDSILYVITLPTGVKDNVQSMSVSLKSKKNIDYTYDSLQTIRFSIGKNSLTFNDSLEFLWGENCMFRYILPVDKPSASLIYKLDTLSALPGDTVVFTLQSEVLSGDLPIQDTVTISMNKYLLYPVDNSPFFDADTVRITIPYTIASNGISSKTIRFLALLGDTNSSIMKINSNTSIPSIYRNGYYTMLPICEDRDVFVKENSKQVLFTLYFANSIYQYNEQIVESTEDLQIELYTLLGKKITSNAIKVSNSEYSIYSDLIEQNQFYMIVKDSKNSLFIPILR